MPRSRIIMELAGDPIRGDFHLRSPAGNPVLSSSLSDVDLLCGECGDVIIDGDPGLPIQPPEGVRLVVTCAKCGKGNLFPL